MDCLPIEIVNKIMLYHIHPVAELFKKEFEICGLADDVDDELNMSLWAVDILDAIIQVREYDGRFVSFNTLDNNLLDYLF